MIAKTVEYICKELNLRYDDPATASLQDFAVLGNVARLDTDTDATQAEMVRNVVVTLVNIEEEKTLKNGSHYVQNGDTLSKRNPTIFLNLYVMFSCADSNHLEALKKISRVALFFQRKNVFTRENTAAPFPVEAGVEKIILDLFTLNFEQINHLWGILGGKYSPSLLYKVRIVAVQNALLDETATVKDIETKANAN